jgi:hypothetical protein
MPSPTFTAQLGLPDPSATPLNVTELVTLLNSLFLPVSVGNYNAQMVTGSNTPAVGDQDKLWFRSDPAGNPMGFYVFNAGVWRPVSNGKTGEITIFVGDPTPFFDGSGKGIPGTRWDGWAACNGQNGTPKLNNKFLVGMETFLAGTTTPATTFTGAVAQSGGNVPSTYTIQESDLPTYNPIFAGANYSAGAGTPTYHILVDNNWINYFQHSTVQDPNTGNTNYGAPPGVPQTPVPITPPYYCVIFVMFIGF